MTAFATARAAVRAAVWLSGEARSVNHRHLEIVIRLPEELRWLEHALREQWTARLFRGKVDLILRLERDPGAEPALALDEGLARRLGDLLARLAESVPGLRVDAGALLAWPGLIREAEIPREEIRAAAIALSGELIARIEAERQREGIALTDTLRGKLEALAAGAAAQRGRLPALREAQRGRLIGRLRELEAEVDENRLAQELALLLARSDVAEELERIEVHAAEGLRLLSGSEAVVGRRLDFLLQELSREANTLAAKAADLELGRFALEARVLIEQLREQVQNLE
jgi:uncharacterized protein (TIGR00255 family)